MKCRPRLTTDKGRITLEMPQTDYWAGYTAWLEAFGIKDKGPVPDSITAAAIVKRVNRQSQAIAAQAVGNGKRSKGKRDAGK